MLDENTKIPAHVAIIMDGNGRWAKAHNIPRALGHKKGCETLEQIVEDAARIGIRHLTVYAFSTENWKRSEEEVGALMQLFGHYAKKLLGIATKNNIKVSMIGEMSKFSEDLRKAIDALETQTCMNTGMTFNIAVNYGSRDEMIRASKKMIRDFKDKDLDPDSLTEEIFSSYLDTKDLPDPDLMIRTSGEERLSNFLLWQLAYAEFYFTPVLWPDFNREELEKAIAYYNGRDRRFGGRNEA